MYIHFRPPILELYLKFPRDNRKLQIEKNKQKVIPFVHKRRLEL